MIIVLRVSSINDKIAKEIASQARSSYQYFPIDVKGENRKYTHITLLDLTADELQSLPSAKSIIDYLEKNQLLDNLQVLDVLIPDIDNALPQFVVDLQTILKEKTNRNIAVKSLTNVQYDYTFIQPPNDKSNIWVVYGLQKKDISPTQKPSLYSLPIIQKTSLWQAQTVEELFDKVNTNIPSATSYSK